MSSAAKSADLVLLEGRLAKAVAAKDYKLAGLLDSAIQLQASIDAAVAARNFKAAEAKDAELKALEAQINALAVTVRVCVHGLSSRPSRRSSTPSQ